jgi:hypothetical protein
MVCLPHLFSEIAYQTRLPFAVTLLECVQKKVNVVCEHWAPRAFSETFLRIPDSDGKGSHHLILFSSLDHMFSRHFDAWAGPKPISCLLFSDFLGF